MGAIAVSLDDEKRIRRLQQELRMPSKSAVVRAALRSLESKSEQERLRKEIRASVSRCAKADRLENSLLSPASMARLAEE